MAIKRKNRKVFSEINITPLTDIFLVLLIIMMVIAPMLDQQGLNLSVPSDSKEQQKEPKIITVDVEKNNTYILDGSAVDAASLLAKIKDEMKVKKDGLLIQSDPDSTHGAVVEVMDAARNAGVESISVIQK